MTISLVFFELNIKKIIRRSICLNHKEHMKHIIILIAIFIGFNALGQITANKVTSIKGKLNKDKLELKKTDAKIWLFIQTENNGSVTRIELNETKANASALTLEQQELGVKIVIDVANLSAIAYSLNEAKQYVESTETTIAIESADDSETVPINDDQIDPKITPKNVSFIKWEHAFSGAIFTLEQSGSKNWTFTQKSKLGGGTPETANLTQTKIDNNSIYLESSGEQDLMLRLQIDLANKKVHASKLFDEVENGKFVKKWMEDGFISDESQQKFLSIK